MTEGTGRRGEKVIGIVQPTYLPWLPFFERMAVADEFVILDDVEFSKNSPHNRNRIKTSRGPLYLTVPVRYKGHSRDLISEMRIAENTRWNEKHLNSLRIHYARARHYARYDEVLAGLYAASPDLLVEAQWPFIDWMRREFGITTPVHFSSRIPAPGRANEKLVGIIRHLGGTHFIVKPGTEEYHPPAFFRERGIELRHLSYTPVRHEQLHGEFLPHLSAIDLLLNCGPLNLREFLAEQAKGGASA